jgi:hypothetical protein
VTPSALEEFAAAMARAKVLRFKGDVGPPEQEGEEECEIELHPSVFEPPTTPATETDPAALAAIAEAEKCACGHDRASEHNGQGLCIAGSCPYSVCHPGATPKPEEG